MKTIPLTQGQFALVDDEDYEWAMQWKWQASWSSLGKTFYATRRMSELPGRPTTWLHRELFGMGRRRGGDPREVDHKDRDTLNCQRSNLRICTQSENAANKRLRSDNRTGFKGVYYHRANRRWVAQITANGNQRYLGIFVTPEEAHAAYCEAAPLMHGEFASPAKKENDNAKA